MQPDIKLRCRVFRKENPFKNTHCSITLMGAFPMRKTSMDRFLTIGAGIVVSSILSSSVSGEFYQKTSRPHGALGYFHIASNELKSAEIGFKVHTNIMGVALAEKVSKSWGGGWSGGGGAGASSPLPSSYYFETPASLACVYASAANTPTSCNPGNSTLSVPTGNTPPTAIAIVDAYDNPTVQRDLKAFASQFGFDLTKYPPKLQVVSASGRRPQPDSTGWSLESSLDVEWAYAMSPTAQIYLVEADFKQP